MKMKYPDGRETVAKYIEHAQRLHDMYGCVPTEDSKIVLEGSTIKMAKRKTTKKKEDSAE